MINPEYYNNKANIVKANNKPPMFAPKRKTIITETNPYIVQYGDTYYSLAVKMFGTERQYLWTIISDCNTPRMPDDLQVGETIKLPKVIIM